MSKYSVIVVMIAFILVAVMPVSSLNETETVAIATTTPVPTATPTVSITATATPTTTTTLQRAGSWPSLEITPDQATLPSGAHVTVRTEIPVSSFPSNRNLLLSTELDNPTWTYYLVLNGVVNQGHVKTENTWSLTGWDLSYPSRITVSVLISLEGTTPTTSMQVNKKIVSI